MGCTMGLCPATLTGWLLLGGMMLVVEVALALALALALVLALALALGLVGFSSHCFWPRLGLSFGFGFEFGLGSACAVWTGVFGLSWSRINFSSRLVRLV